MNHNNNLESEKSDLLVLINLFNSHLRMVSNEECEEAIDKFSLYFYISEPEIYQLGKIPVLRKIYDFNGVATSEKFFEIIESSLPAFWNRNPRPDEEIKRLHDEFDLIISSRYKIVDALNVENSKVSFKQIREKR